MLPKHLIKKIRRIQIRTNRIVDDVMGGQYLSVFKGRGMEFSEVREYQVGDDIRSIDWNVTARTGQPHVKKFIEERELTVMFVVDASSSNDFGTRGCMKGEMAAEVCALLAFSAIRNNDRIGLIIFSDEVELIIPPRKGSQHVLRVIRELLYFRPRRRGTDISVALETLGRVIHKKSVVFLVSDFLASDYESALKIASRRHDLMALSITDPAESVLPSMGILTLEDAETGEIIEIDTSDQAGLRRFAENQRREREERQHRFKSLGIDYLELSTNEEYLQPLLSLFRRRAKKVRR